MLLPNPTLFPSIVTNIKELKYLTIREIINCAEFAHGFLFLGNRHYDDGKVCVKLKMYHSTDNNKWIETTNVCFVDKKELTDEILNKISISEKDIDITIEMERLLDIRINDDGLALNSIIKYKKIIKELEERGDKITKQISIDMLREIKHSFINVKELDYFCELYPNIYNKYNSFFFIDDWIAKMVKMKWGDGVFLFRGEPSDLVGLICKYIELCLELNKEISKLKIKDEIFKEKLREAELGDIEAMSFLGEAYSTGRGCVRDLERALYYYEQSTRLGSEKNIYKLAECYAKGEGTEKNGSKAIELYECAANNGNYEAMRIVAGSYIARDVHNVLIEKATINRENNFGQAKSLYEKGIEVCKNNGGDLAEYCYCIAEDIINKTDDKELLIWAEDCYLNAIGLGHIPSMKKLPFLKNYMENFKNNFIDEYSRWLKKDAKLYHLDMLEAFGEKFLSGDIVKSGKNKPLVFKKELKYLKHCLRNGDNWLVYTLGQIYYYGYTRLAITYKKMDKLYSQAANSRQQIYAVEWGDLYLDGHIECQNKENKAIEIYTKAAMHGDIRGIERLKKLQEKR